MAAMKPTKTLLVLALMLVPAVAFAQRGGYYSQPQAATELPGGFHNRMGRLAWGFSIGLGGMHDAGSQVTSCNNCDYNPIAVEADAHIGGFISPRFALMGEVQVNGKTVQLNGYDGDTIISQNALMLAGQFWISPQFWIKGGIGFAHMQADDAYFTYDVGDGGVVMGAVGFEVFSARDMAVDLQGRLIQGAYNGIDDKVTSGTVGVGINWY